MWLIDIFRIGKIKEENANLKKRIDALGVEEYEQTQKKIEELFQKNQAKIDEDNKTIAGLNDDIASFNTIIGQLTEEVNQLKERQDKLNKQFDTQTKKLTRSKELYKSITYCIDTFLQSDEAKRLSSSAETDLEDLSPSVILKLHSMDVKSLRSAIKENTKSIDKVLESYRTRYTTKANRAIYELMVIALRAELQNILCDLKYEKLDNAVENVKEVTRKYLRIASSGNQSIAGTLTRFVGEIEYLFIDAVKIEYNYYVKKEQARQEQLAIKQQMREEAEERKALMEQRRKIEQEESKFQGEIDKAKEAIATATDEDQIAALKAKLLKLEGQLSEVAVKKEEISNLQNGKAGNVYIISNLGSFGENIFKIGMTRRMDPQERIDELGSASVPFKFDVHSLIFSNDAVKLEHDLHTRLNDKRVNKVNLRKEFFYSSIDELEELVNKLDSTAEFKRTMLAEEFRQSMSTDKPYTSDIDDGDESDDEGDNQ